MKQRFTLVLCCMICICNMAYANAQEDGPIGLWHFNEGHGNIAYDSSGNKNNGWIKGGVAWVNGISGSALKFNGADAYVEIPNSKSLNTPAAITICAWIKVDQKSSVGRALTIADKTRGTIRNKGWHLYWDDRILISNGIKFQALALSLGNNTGKKVSNVAADMAVTDSEWHFVAGIIDSKSSEYQHKLYVDGELVGGKNNAFNIAGNTLPLLIGVANPSTTVENGGTWFNGGIDEVSIYNRALTSDEILSLYKFKGEVGQ